MVKNIFLRVDDEMFKKLKKEKDKYEPISWDKFVQEKVFGNLKGGRNGH